MRGSRLVFAWLIFIQAPAAFAEIQIQDLRVWRRAQTVTPNQQVWSFESSYQNSKDRFAPDGHAEALGRSLSRGVTWKQLLGSGAVRQSALDQSGANGDDLAATSTYQVQQQEIGFGVNWAYGLTRTWMIGFEIPAVLRSTRITQHVEMSPALGQSVNQADVAKRVQGLAQSQLTQAGYAQIPEQKQTLNLGDVSLLSQFILTQNYSWAWSFQQQVRVPTAQNPSVSDYVDTSRDEGPVGLGLSSLLDYQWQRWIFGARIGYMAQLPDEVRMRVNSGENQNTVDPIVHRRLGDYVWGAMDAEYRLTQNLNLTGEYSMLSKDRDVYTGGTLAADYSQMGRNTDAQLHQARFGFFYRMGAARNQWIVSMDYIYPLIGRNAADAARAAFDIIKYF